MTPAKLPHSSEVELALASDLTIDITTIGRKSGQSRRIEIWFLNVEGDIYITGTPGRRDWFANLQANAGLTFHLKESVRADLDATATVVTDRVERERVFSAPTARWYLEQGDTREEVLSGAPMIRLEFHQ